MLTTVNLDLESDNEDLIQEEIQKWKTEADERRLGLHTQPTVYELDSWLQFTKCHVVLTQSQHNLVKTVSFVRYPGPDESELQQVLGAWDRIRTRALDTLENVDHKDALKWWVSPKNEIASQHPFELPQSSATLNTYSRIWAQFLCYMPRTNPVEFEEKIETGVKYSRDQWKALSTIWDTLEADDPHADSYILVTQVMRLCQLAIMQDISKLKLYDSPLMHYLAVRGIESTAEGFRGPMHYTSILAGMLWIIRLHSRGGGA